MRQYQVPQFIDIEDKIIGPLTIKQFLYLVAGGGICVIAYYLFNFIFFLIITAPVALLALALAFVKINGVPFAKLLSGMITYLLKPHLYLWKQLPPEKKSIAAAEAEQEPLGKVPTLTDSKLQDLAWSLDIKEKIGND
jgi:hypothetical protein